MRRALITLALLALTPTVARAETYPPVVPWEWLMNLVGFQGTTINAPFPTGMPIVYQGDTLQVTFWLTKGRTEDKAARVYGAGDTHPGEEGNNNEECYVEKKQASRWRMSHCNLPGGNVELGPGEYTYTFYWRTKNGEPWQKMNVVHFTIAEIGGGGGRTAKAGFRHVWDVYKDAAAIVLNPDQDEVTFRHWSMPIEAGKDVPEGECRFWVGLFLGKELKALGRNRDHTTDCWSAYNSWKKRGSVSGVAIAPDDATFKMPDGMGNQGERFKVKDLLGKDGSWTVVAVTGTFRRSWSFAVKGGKIVTAPRQQDDFKPAHYQWFADNDRGGFFWLAPGNEASQPLALP